MIAKRSLGAFLKRNPFDKGWTDGLFYREKMRAIHRIAPAELPDGAHILEVGGGLSRLAASLFPDAQVLTIDIDPALAALQLEHPNARFMTADACDLPFDDGTFDLVTMFDVLEHIPDDSAAAREAMRVTKPGGIVLISTPDADWHYPYYKFMGPHCPPEKMLMDEWGHVRRGYRMDQLKTLFQREPSRTASFINPVTAFFHDVAFSRFGPRRKRLLYAAAALPTAVAYALHRPSTKGTEIACAWPR
ncbi:MAG: putative methyl transferase [Sphingomonas bacterium]|nr:putative methyl transferase [Sphingomonas bacterium]